MFSGSWGRFFAFLSRSPEARFGTWLAVLCLLAGGVRLAVLAEFLAESPFAWLPRSDGGEYWRHAGELAAGRGWGDTPFLMAPLYPLLLAGLRRAGGDLVTLYALQLAAHLATAALLADATRRRFGAGAGVLAAALFLGLAEPALFATRVLSVTLQLLCVGLLYWDWTGLAQREARSPGHVARVGAEVGLLTLAYPPGLLLIPVFGGWLAWTAADRGAALRSALVGTAAAAALVAPATFHNAWVSGELIPVTAHGGLTLRHGNGPGSDGIYTPVEGVGTAIADQHRDAARVFREAHGRDGSWREIDAWFRGQVVGWWLAHPFEATSLFARKLYWTLTSRDYDNVTAFALERDHGLADRSRLLPLEVPWLVGLAALGLWLARRRPRQLAPELALLGLPVAVCLVFYYSARYRLPAVPVICALAAGALWQVRALHRGALSAALLLPFALLSLNAATGFGSLDFLDEPFARSLADSQVRLGRQLWSRGEATAAEERFRRALDADPGHAPARRALAQALYNADVAGGDFASARARLENLASETPEDAEARLALAWLLATCPDASLRSAEAALRHAEEAARVAGDASPDVQLALAVARAEGGDFDGALRAARRGAALLREHGLGDAARSFEDLAAQLEARRPVRGEPRWLRVAAGERPAPDHSI